MTNTDNVTNGAGRGASPVPALGEIIELHDEAKAVQWRDRMLAAVPEKRGNVPSGSMLDERGRAFVLRKKNAEVGYIHIIDVTGNGRSLPNLPSIWQVSGLYILPAWQGDGAAMIALMRYVNEHADTHLMTCRPNSKAEERMYALCGFPVFSDIGGGRKLAMSPDYAVAIGAIKFAS